MSAQEKSTDSDAKPAGKKGKLLWIIIAVVLLGGVGGGVYAFLPHGSGEHKAAPPEPPVFLPLEAFTVNLLPADGLQQYLQVQVTLKIAGQPNADALKARMPEVRSRVVMLLSGKRASELLVTAGKEKLAREVGDAVRSVVQPAKEPAKADAKGHAPAAAEKGTHPAEGTVVAEGPQPFEVLFTGFIIQ